MKTTILIASLLFVIPVKATTYYVSTSSGNNANSGLSPSLAWQTVSKVNSITFLPGDSILFKRGDVWKSIGSLFFTESGTSVNPIVVASYGVGIKPIITDILPIAGYSFTSNWTNVSTNVWRMKYLPGTSPNRLWLNGSEVLVSVILADVGVINSEGTLEKWFYSSTDSMLYVHSIGNPATTYTTMDGNNPSGILALYSNSYITIDGLDFQGGRWSTIYISNGSYHVIKNCNIGYGLTGISVTATSFSLTSHHITIENNLFDSGLNFLYGLSSTSSNGEKRGNEDGITFTFAVNNSIIRNNTFTGWGHAAINFYCTNSSYDGIYDNKIYKNTFTGTNNSYNRVIGMDGNEGKTYNNEFYFNLIKDHKVRSQINGNNNWVHHNIFDGQTTSPARYYGLDGSGQAIEMSVYGSQYVSHGNKIDNNLFINTTEAAIVLRSYGGFPNKSVNHLIRNNIFNNTGYQTALAADAGLAIKLTTTIEAFNNIFQNNCINNPGKPATSAIKYYGALLSVAQFNLQNGNNSNTMTNNIQLDPMFINNTNDFHLQPPSPCIDSGIVITGLTLDLDGNSIFSGITSDIGPYEFTSGVGILKYSMNKKNISVSPNPSSGEFTFKTQDVRLQLIEIFDATGSKILEERFVDPSLKININVKPGIYFYKVSSRQEIISSGKIIIQ